MCICSIHVEYCSTLFSRFGGDCLTSYKSILILPGDNWWRGSKSFFSQKHYMLFLSMYFHFRLSGNAVLIKLNVLENISQPNVICIADRYYVHNNRSTYMKCYVQILLKLLIWIRKLCLLCCAFPFILPICKTTQSVKENFE